MRRSALLIAAVLIAAIGTAMIVLYVKGIDDRATEGQELVEVLTATSVIDAGETVGAAQEAGKFEAKKVRRDDMVDGALDSGTIRSVLLAAEGDARAAALVFLKDAVPDAVRHYLSAWWETPVRSRLAAETEWVRKYRKRWPAEQTMTVDAVVTCSNHVLLIERGDGAGAGLFAVPGGFLEKDERFYEGAKRELREETGLGYIGDGLDATFARAEVFDRPDRSLRARIVTVAHLFELKATPLPDVQGRDDARRALWVPIADLPGMEDRFFEDHFQILDHFLELTQSRPRP